MSEVKVLDTVKLSRIKKMVNSLDLHSRDGIDMDVSLEYLLASLFPTCYANIQDELKRQHTLGYMQGLEEGKQKNLK